MVCNHVAEWWCGGMVVWWQGDRDVQHARPLQGSADIYLFIHLYILLYSPDGVLLNTWFSLRRLDLLVRGCFQRHSLDPCGKHMPT